MSTVGTCWPRTSAEQGPGKGDRLRAIQLGKLTLSQLSDSRSGEARSLALTGAPFKNGIDARAPGSRDHSDRRVGGLNLLAALVAARHGCVLGERIEEVARRRLAMSAVLFLLLAFS